MLDYKEQLKELEEKLTSDLAEQYNQRNQENLETAPREVNYISILVYNEKKFIREFPLKDYENNLDLLGENPQGVMKENLLKCLTGKNYAVQTIFDKELFTKRFSKFGELQRKTLNNFKLDLFKKYECTLENKDDMFALALKWAKEGSFYFIEEAFLAILCVI